MKSFAVIAIALVSLMFLSFSEDEKEVKIEKRKTGIILDSMNNEVLLVLENDKPAYYMSEIFTPVCNTGECLPVYINIYWHLNGTFKKFNQPEGEILTKLDHQPFTEDDYDLLDEIIRGNDPRLSRINSSHSQVKHDKQDAQASPAVAEAVKMDKHIMVDGITGSTLPELKDQFVPGALYTTYTIWGLANDHFVDIRNYTKKHLLKKYQYHLLAHKELECQMMVLDKVESEDKSETARMDFLVELIDSGDSLMQDCALSHMYFKYYMTDEVQEVLDRTFYGESTFLIKRSIIYDWAYKATPLSTLLKLSENLLKYEEHFPEIMLIYENKIDYPEGMVQNMADTFPKLKIENQKIMAEWAVNQKKYFSKEDWEIIKQVK